MDPLNRLLWWRETDRAVYDRAHQFHGWHELLTRYLCGRAVSDHGLAGKFFAYDLATRDWSPALLDAWEIEARLLPDLEPFGTPVGVILPDVARCAVAARGRGGRHRQLRHVVRARSARAPRCPACSGLVVGSWESLVAPIDAPLPARDVIDGRLAVGPHAGASGLGVFALSPNGTVALDRIRDLLSVSIIELTAMLEASGPAPEPGARDPAPVGRHQPLARRQRLDRLAARDQPRDVEGRRRQGVHGGHRVRPRADDRPAPRRPARRRA